MKEKDRQWISIQQECEIGVWQKINSCEMIRVMQKRLVLLKHFNNFCSL